MPTEHILMLSYGKDSLACLGAIKELGWPLDRIIHAEVWATDDIPADLPPMVEFKSHADAWIKENFGIEVEHISAMKDGEKLTFEKLFYHKPKRKKDSRAAALVNAAKEGGQVLQWTSSGIPSLTLTMVQQQSQSTTSTDGHSQSEDGAGNSSMERILGFPMLRGMWCNSKLKMSAFSKSSLALGANINMVQYLGIAADEPVRISRHTKEGNLLPLVEMGWDEAYCRQWCEERGLLSPIYTTSSRGGASSVQCNQQINYDCSEEIIQTTGNLCSNGTWTVLLPSNLMVTLYGIMTNDLMQKTKV